ncbi:MAG: VOC family protein, partial [Acidobacteria bacterium]|nr:VOC family protein [Acidobacteriota bacterium]
MIKGLHHTNIVVSDMTRTKRFYTETLGLEISLEVSIEDSEFSRGAGLADTRVVATFFSVPGSNTLIETFQYLNPSSRPMPS